MARNEEKNLSQLNRYYLQQEEIKAKEKSPDRPSLHTLKTAEEVTKWIPSIKKEINYYVQQTSGVRNYPDHKIAQFNKKIEDLQQEYNDFVNKAKRLDPIKSSFAKPGELHPYISKRKIQKAKQEKKAPVIPQKDQKTATVVSLDASTKNPQDLPLPNEVNNEQTERNPEDSETKN